MSTDPDWTPEQERRASCLPWAIGGFTIGFFCLLLTIATGGYFMWFMVLVGGIASVGGLHYLLWGRLMESPAEEEKVEEEPPPAWRNDGDGEGIRRPRGGL